MCAYLVCRETAKLVAAKKFHDVTARDHSVLLKNVKKRPTSTFRVLYNLIR